LSTASPVIPPRAEYRLTKLGRRFLGLASMIAEWTMAQSPPMATSVPLPDAHSLPLAI
jgi:DNA-binding HxlR family transcriptional regulator